MIQCVEDAKELLSYDVTMVFTSVPMDKVVCVRKKLESDNTLQERTNIGPN